LTSDSRGTASTFAQLGTVTKYSFLNYLRARRFLVMVLIVSIINLALTAAVAYTRSAAFLDSTPLGFYGAWWGSFIDISILLTVVFFGGDAISGEFQNKTGYFLAPNPVRRSTLYVGKYLAAFIASTLILVLFLAFTLANGLYYGMGVPTQFAESFLFAWLYLLTALGVTFMFSSLFKTTSISILITVLLFLFVFTVIDELSTILLKIEPWFSITYAEGIIANILTVPFPLHYVAAITSGPGARFSFPTYNATVPEGLEIMAVYLIVCSLLGLLIFERKEFN
jgi:ABC-2 type transport system permease protein